MISMLSEAGSTVLSQAITQSSSILTLMGDISTFIVGNELCMLVLGFGFISRGVSLLKKSFRAAPH